MKDKKIAVWFSCGAASAVAAKLIVDYYGYSNIVYVCNNPIKEEGEDNPRFLQDVSDWIGYPIKKIKSTKYPNASCKEVWDNKKYMSGIYGAPCTLELKKKPRQEWEARYRPDYTVLGFTAEEQSRADRFRLTERDTLLTPLIDLGLTKQDCFNIINKAGLRLPDLYKNGHPNANCLGCVKVNSPTYWNWLRVTYPKVFKDRLEQSDRIGTKLVRVKGEYISLKDLNPKAKGNKMKSYDVDCGIFCEEGAWKND
tara:strand:+ start:58 stop:819 length:762 start_codon:yes stop_codon:yes gene_type:complete